MNQSYKLYGTGFSLYTAKVRSYLLKKGLPFDEVLSTVKVYKDFIVPRTGVRYVPVLQTPDDRVLQDTTVIIDALEERHPELAIYPATPKQRLVALLLETYADEWLVIPAMHYRWGYPEINQPFIFQQFGLVIAPKFPKFIRGWLGKKLAARFSGMVPLLGISKETIPAIEQSYQQLLADLNTHFSQYNYLLGDRPSIADFGFIGPFYAHLYHDPYPSKILRARAPAVVRWIQRMTDTQPAKGNFLSNDEIPATLLPILKRMVDEQMPVLLDTDAKLSLWRSENPNTSIPRSIGKHQFSIEGVTGERIIIPYALWMLKRSVDFYEELSTQEKTSVQKMINDLGLDEVLAQGLNNQLARKNNKLVFINDN